MKKYPCVYMRGGTSKALIFNKKDLPDDKNKWKQIFLKVMGSPDPKQIDGIGGTHATTSKIAVISKSEAYNIDINYEFYQVSVKEAKVDDEANCGNISSAVGPYAIDEGLVKITEPVTTVRILNTNTNKIIEEKVRVHNGKSMVNGEEKIAGVPGTGSRIDVFFEYPGGAVTGELFPTKNKKDTIKISDDKEIEITIIDCANPFVFVKANDIGLEGTEIERIDENTKLLNDLEKIRGLAAVKLGFVDRWEDAKGKSSTVPKISIVSRARNYTSLDKELVKSDSIDLCSRAISSSGGVHKSYPITGYVAIGAASMIKGTVVNEVSTSENSILKVGHPSGLGEISVELENEDVKKVGVVRTARRIMDGFIYINI